MYNTESRENNTVHRKVYYFTLTNVGCFYQVFCFFICHVYCIFESFLNIFSTTFTHHEDRFIRLPVTETYQGSLDTAQKLPATVQWRTACGYVAVIPRWVKWIRRVMPRSVVVVPVRITTVVARILYASVGIHDVRREVMFLQRLRRPGLAHIAAPRVRDLWRTLLSES